jgi:hypothetical protein
MLWTIFVILVVLWLFGMWLLGLSGGVGGSLIHYRGGSLFRR